MKWSGSDFITEFIDFDGSKHEEFIIDESGKIAITPAGSGIGWFSDSKGTFLYKNVSGNFMIETEVEVKRINEEAGEPKAQFSSGGLLIRNPQSKKGKEQWLMYNLGFQNSFFGREIKVTRDSNGLRWDPTYFLGYKSLSTLFLLRAKGQRTAKLRIARVKDEVRCYYYDQGHWIEETPTEDMELMGNGAQYPVANFNHSVFRPNAMALPDSLQVGIVANPGMDLKKPFIKFRDAYMIYSYIQIDAINSFEDCL